MGDYVIILHGIFRTHRSMRGLAKHFERAGYEVLNLGYPSTKHDLAALADIIHPRIREFASDPARRIHFVGYSMGGLLIRAYLKKYRPAQLGRVVMVGTPNKGSEVADFLQGWKLYRWLYGPAGQQLVTAQEPFAHLFCDDFECGVIMGNRSIDPVSSRIIGKPNDGKVSMESALLDCAKDHTVIGCSHTFFPGDKRMWKAAVGFVERGEFGG